MYESQLNLHQETQAINEGLDLSQNEWRFYWGKLRTNTFYDYKNPNGESWNAIASMKSPHLKSRTRSANSKSEAIRLCLSAVDKVINAHAVEIKMLEMEAVFMTPDPQPQAKEDYNGI